MLIEDKLSLFFVCLSDVDSKRTHKIRQNIDFMQKKMENEKEQEEEKVERKKTVLDRHVCYNIYLWMNKRASKVIMESFDGSLDKIKEKLILLYLNLG